MSALPKKGLLYGYFLAIIIWPISAFASNITMEYRIGFNDRFQLGQWTPLTLFIENRDRTLAGTLQVIVTSGSEYRGDVYSVTHSTDIELHTNSKKRYSFTVRLNSFSHPLRIQLKEADRIILTESINLRPYYVNNGFGVVISEKASTADWSLLPNGMHPITSQALFLPEAWYGYDSVDLLIIHTPILSALNDNQTQALEGWVKRGGYLVFFGGSRTNILLSKRFKGLLPMTVSGFEWIDKLESMPDFCGHPFKAPHPFLIPKTVIEDSTVLLSQNEIPVIVQKDVDLGGIVFIAFDYTASWFQNWEGQKAFWENVYKHRPILRNQVIDLDVQAVSRNLLSAIPSRFPDIILSLIIILIYLILMILFFSKLKKRKRPNWRVLILFLTSIIIFSATGYWIYLKKGTQKNVTHNSFVILEKSAGKSPMIPNKQVIGLYALENTDQTIFLDLDNRPFVPLSSLDKKDKTFPVRDIRITEKNNQHVLSISFKRWSYCFLMTDSFTHFPFQADISKNDDTICLSWSNPTPHRITNSYIYLNGYMFYIGDMDASQKGKLKIPMSNMISVEQFQEQMEEYLSHKASTPLPGVVFGPMGKSILDNVVNHIRGSHQAKGHTLYLLGWIAPPIVPYSFQAPDSLTAALTLLMWEIPVGGKSDFH